ncbi:MAG TPA: phosphosulfolactate synthase [Candidatus Dormibacteraeota bacterium]|nr:phosphosulfolactate synthase [Candidatus Dormibacteraeota bacterium]
MTGPGAGFLDLAPRVAKPRAIGLTHVIDRGTPLPALETVVEWIGDVVDVWKFGWGTAYVDPAVRSKVDILRRHEILSCPGGTLLEVACLRGRADRFLGWAAEVGFTAVEVSNGATGMSGSDKRLLIREASRYFHVLSEVGSKDPRVVLQPAAWETDVRADVEAGARWVVLEGRESGSVGLYDPQGRVKEDLVAQVTAAIGLERLVFEAPRKEQQAWFIRHFGPDVNLGNISPDDVLGLETLRLGLRADTIALLR